MHWVMNTSPLFGKHIMQPLQFFSNYIFNKPAILNYALTLGRNYIIIQVAYHHVVKVFIFHKYYAGTDSNLKLSFF